LETLGTLEVLVIVIEEVVDSLAPASADGGCPVLRIKFRLIALIDRHDNTRKCHGDTCAMLPPEILDQVTALNLQHREVVTAISQLSGEITNQFILDDISAKVKGAFADADRAIENLESTVEMEEDPRIKMEAEVYLAKVVEDFKLYYIPHPPMSYELSPLQRKVVISKVTFTSIENTKNTTHSSIRNYLPVSTPS
jgi:hypothetical protein